jgi:hypothetical protein
VKTKPTKKLHIRPIDLMFDDPLNYARMIQREYAEDHNADLPAFLQSAYYAYLRFRSYPEAFGNALKHDDYWDSWRKK